MTNVGFVGRRPSVDGRLVMGRGFAGRVSELAALEAAWLAAAGNEAAPVVVVYGEPGIGKTRTVAELARVVRARGAPVLWGTCHEGEAHPYAVWAEAIRGYADRVGGEGLVAVVGPEVRWLAPLRSDLAGVESARVNVPAGVARLRLAEVLARVLDSFERPPVVVLDDMHWAYPESLELFGHVARLASGALVVVCCRGVGLDLEHPLARRMAEVQRHRECRYVALDGLSREEAGELLEQAAGEPLEAGLVDRVYEESGGNPFFLGELGRHLHGDSSVRGMRPVPHSIRGAVGLRLEALSAQTRHVLQLASVFTAGFRFAELQGVTELEEAAVLDSLEEALGEELIRPLDGERYDFAHALVRQTLSERMSPSRRARLHRRVAAVLERLHKHDLAQVAGELVHQYHASATLPGAERGAVYALTAASAARGAGASADGVMTLRLGLDLVVPKDTDTRARVLGELARAEAEAGLAEDAPRTLEAAVALLEDGGAPGEAIADLVYAVGVAFAFAVALRRLPAIEALIVRGLAAVGDTRSLAWARLKLLRRFARPEAFGPVRGLRPVPLDPDAVRIARSEGTEADYALTIDSWDGSFAADLEPLIDRISRWRDPLARLRVLVSVVGHLTLADPRSSPSADHLCDELQTLADDVGSASNRALARVFRAALLGGQADFDGAAEQLTRAQGVWASQPAPGAMPGVGNLVRELTVMHVEADWPRVAEVMWEQAVSPEEAGWFGLRCAALAAQAFACAGEVERAREVLGHILPAFESGEPLDPVTSCAIGLAGGAVWELRAQDLAERLLPCALAVADADGPEFYMTSTELTVARLCAVLGRFDQAVAYFDRARVTLDRRDQQVLRAVVDYDEGLARLAHNQPGAAERLALASERFEELGMREWSRRAALLQVPDCELPDNLTAREAEILRLLALGHTNKEMAAELVISVHTVERHVQNAYAKIGARNRAEARAYVARVDL